MRRTYVDLTAKEEYPPTAEDHEKVRKYLQKERGKGRKVRRTVLGMFIQNQAAKKRVDS